MHRLEIKKDWMRRGSRDLGVLEPADRQRIVEYLETQTKEYILDVVLSDWPMALWRSMLNEAKLTSAARSAIALHVFGMKQSNVTLNQLYETKVNDPVEFGTTFEMAGCRAPNCEYLLNGRWYPVIVSVQFIEDEQKWTKGIQLLCQLSIGRRTFDVSDYLSREMFSDEGGAACPRTIAYVLEKFGYRRLQMPVSEFNLRLVKSERASVEHGHVVLVQGAVLKPSEEIWWRGFESQALGTTEMPVRCVIEADLDTQADERHNRHRFGGHHEESISRLPFVRVFCLETKSYVYADVDDIVPCEFDTQAIHRLHLPNDMHAILQRVFDTPVEKLFGDLLKGKHGGVVVLANGEPGVGKTLTAEIYAETTERPLYVLELGELGTDSFQVEVRLQSVFARVTRWNAVLQFDECEIFLAKRGTDSERSAIVGIFLRLLDYYRGLLFLTTNRPEVLDDAVLSRVMLRLEYPKLNPTTRARIWRSMFSMAGLQLEGCSFESIAEFDLNGRQIRNITRLTRFLNPQKVITAAAMREALRFGAGVQFSESQLL